MRLPTVLRILVLALREQRYLLQVQVAQVMVSAGDLLALSRMKRKMLLSSTPRPSWRLRLRMPSLSSIAAVPRFWFKPAIVEVSGDDATQLGVQWALGNANSGYGVVNFNNVRASAVSLAAAALSGGENISASSRFYCWGVNRYRW